MLGNDLLGFHLQYHCANFLETIERFIEARVDTEHAEIARGGHNTIVRSFPISIDFEERGAMAGKPDIAVATAQWIQELGSAPEILGIGIDRIDYTKGIPTDSRRSIGCWRNIPGTSGACGSCRSQCPAGRQSGAMQSSTVP